jgi:hypothetical protein
MGMCAIIQFIIFDLQVYCINTQRLKYTELYFSLLLVLYGHEIWSRT